MSSERKSVLFLKKESRNSLVLYSELNGLE